MVTLGHLRVTIGHLRVTICCFFISKHKANTTELHPKVRQTCFIHIHLESGARRGVSFLFSTPWRLFDLFKSSYTGKGYSGIGFPELGKIENAHPKTKDHIQTHIFKQYSLHVETISGGVILI